MLHQLAPNYISTGKARVVAHHMAFLGDESQWAAEAAECANEQARYWDYANYVLSHQAGENVGAFSKANLTTFAQKVGLDTAQFSACLDSGRNTLAVKNETAQGQARGVTRTPTFFVNGQKIEGLLSAQKFGQLLDSLQKQ